MKHCSNKDCKQQNPQSKDNFHKNKHHKDGLTSQCKHCKSQKEKLRYQDPAYKEYNSKRVHGKIYRKHKKDLCERCGFVPEDLCQLDVDHIDGNRQNNEVGNLQTLCANCHRLKTKLNKDTRWS